MLFASGIAPNAPGICPECRLLPRLVPGPNLLHESWARLHPEPDAGTHQVISRFSAEGLTDPLPQYLKMSSLLGLRHDRCERVVQVLRAQEWWPASLAVLGKERYVAVGSATTTSIVARGRLAGSGKTCAGAVFIHRSDTSAKSARAGLVSKIRSGLQGQSQQFCHPEPLFVGDGRDARVKVCPTG